MTSQILLPEQRKIRDSLIVGKEGGKKDMCAKLYIHCVDQEGHLVDFESSEHEGKEVIEKYPSYVMWLNSVGLEQLKKFTPRPRVEKPIFDPNVTKPCPNCGAAMNPRSGTNKLGKPYKGWFCSNPDAQTRGCKPVWAQ